MLNRIESQSVVAGFFVILKKRRYLLVMIANIFYSTKGEFQWGSIAALISLIAAIIAAGSSVYGVKKNSQTQTKISADNNELQKRLQKEKIDADIIAKARIQWIEHVRAAYSSLVESYLESFQGNQKERQEKLNGVKKNTVLMILFFADDKKDVSENNPDPSGCIQYIPDKGISIEEIAKIKMLSITNKGKNKYFVMYFRAMEQLLTEAINNPHDIIENFLPDKLKDEVLRAVPKGSEVRVSENAVSTSARADESITRSNEGTIYRKSKESLFWFHVERLTDYLRLYLKIEWDRVKR